MALEIFKDQQPDATVNAKVINDGIIQVDISGVLEGADLRTYFINDEGGEVLVRDCSWMTSKGDVLEGADGATKYIQKRNLRFILVNTTASTSISVSVTHESGDIEKII